MEAFSCDPAGTRTQGPNIKSVVLYQLSYEIREGAFPHRSLFGSAKISPCGNRTKTFSVYYQQEINDGFENNQPCTGIPLFLFVSF